MTLLTLSNTLNNTPELDSLRDVIMASVRHTVCFDVANDETYAQCGNSRAGGNPDLPKNIAWPLLKNGKPMVFVAQINLAEASACDTSALLPASGTLFFFFGDELPVTRMEHAVIYAPTTAELQLVQPNEPPWYTASKPELFGAASTALSPFSGVCLTPRAGINIAPLPYAETEVDRAADALDDEDAENLPEVYDATAQSFNRAWLCKSFGYGEEHNGDLEYEAALRIHADKPYDCFTDSALATLAEHFNGDAMRARQAVDNTLLLLEVRSNEHTGFMWGYNGVLHFCIDRDDLLHLRFERTYVNMYYA